MYCKLGQVYITNRGSFVTVGLALLFQIGASIVTNWGSYYKFRQPLLQNRSAITSWGKVYYKLQQVLKIREIITN